MPPDAAVGVVLQRPGAGDPAGPLAGIVVVDFTRLIAGPCASDLLAGMGARVIKVEPHEGDAMRNARSRDVQHSPVAPSFAAYNLLNESVALNLKDPADLQRALSLCASADAVMSAFRPGVMERLGLGAEQLRAANPRVVIATLSAFGNSGPERDRGGVDIVLQAETGLMAVTGESGGEPLKVGTPIIDAASGYVLALGLVAALLGRERGTGPTEQVDVSMLEVGLHLQAQPFAEYLASGRQPARVGNCAPYAAPADVYHASDGLLVLSAHLPAHWRRLCEVLGIERLIDDPRFLDVGDRVRNREQLNGELAGVLMRRTADEWVQLLTAAGLTAGKIRSYRELEESTQLAARGAIISATNVDGSPMRVVRPPLRFSLWDDRGLPRRVPGVGEHTEEVTGELRRSPNASGRLQRGAR
jgi:crotonobetainyl-CoA:carnitine CoA-transferase CaiB-like acyl-CoA transferase